MAKISARIDALVRREFPPGTNRASSKFCVLGEPRQFRGAFGWKGRAGRMRRRGSQKGTSDEFEALRCVERAGDANLRVGPDSTLPIL